MFPRVFLLALWLAGVAWGQSSLVISEFLASNSQVLADADGDYPDWIEIQNTGTAPMSSIRMFNALQGLGKTAALYLYPYEDHSVMTYASDLDQWARWIAWFDTHLTGARR